LLFKSVSTKVAVDWGGVQSRHPRLLAWAWVDMGMQGLAAIGVRRCDLSA